MIYTFNVESKHHNDDGLIGAMKRIMVNKNNAMTTVLSMQREYIIILTFLWYDICNNVYVEIKLY